MALTAHQQAALARMPKNRRAAAVAGFERQNKQKNNGNGNGKGKGTGTGRRLAQGVGAIPPKAYGGRDAYTLACWDATHPSHLPLPRAVGDYTIIRTTKRIPLAKQVCMIGTFQREQASLATPRWSNICAVTDNVASNPVNGAANTRVYTFDLSGFGSAATVVPAALTVQIMNPEALQTTAGITYIGVMKTQAAWGGSTDTWETRAGQFVQYMAPRLCSAGKLALRGVKVNSFPLNMTALADFQELELSNDTNAYAWNGDDFQPVGMAPIVIYNTVSSGEVAALELLVTVEWRVRFDITNPASAGHTQHPCASDSTWQRLMRAASSMGHGVRDIAETVASAGAAAEGMGKLAALAAV